MVTLLCVLQIGTVPGMCKNGELQGKRNRAVTSAPPHPTPPTTSIRRICRGTPHPRTALPYHVVVVVVAIDDAATLVPSTAVGSLVVSDADDVVVVGEDDNRPVSDGGPAATAPIPDGRTVGTRCPQKGVTKI